jgi:proline iminopeptidase
MKLKITILLIAIVITHHFTVFAQKQATEKLITVNGTNLFVKTIGKGEPLLIVHGGPGLAHNYLYESFKQLSDRYKLIFFDQRGCGRSSEFKQGDSITMNDLVEDVEGLREYFNLKDFCLIGQSWGAIIAINYSLKYPTRVKKLLLLEPGPGSSEYLGKIQNTILERLSANEKDSLIKFTRSPYLKSNPEIFKKFISIRTDCYFFDKELAKKPRFDYFDSTLVKKFFESSAMYSTYMVNYNLYNECEKLSIPTLIIHGDFDVIPNESIERYKKSIKNSELHIFDNCGHFVHIEKPKEYFTLIRGFIR